MPLKNKRSILIFGLFFMFLLLIPGCSNNEEEVITISKDGSFDAKDCKNRGLNDKVIMLESKFCGHCKATLPNFKEACDEKGVEPIILDLSENEQRIQMLSYGVTIQFTPTFIFGCDYVIGVRNKQEYLELLDKFLKEVKK